MKNKRTLATLQDAVDTELANAKIVVDAIAQAVRGRLAWYREHAASFEFLFADLQTVIQKADEDFQMVVRARIENHQRIEAEKAERVRQEQEAARQRAEAEARVREEAAVRAREEEAAQAAATPAPAPVVEAQTAASAEVTPIASARPAAAPPAAPTLRLGQIAERLGFSLTADFLASLGFGAAGRERAAVLYHEQDFPAMCAALIRHVTAVAQAKAA